MSAHKMHHSPELLQAMKNHGLVIETPSQLSDCFRFGWTAATDLSQATVAAALEAAANEMWPMLRSMISRGDAAKAIRSLITPDQHDALSAHVAAEVAKALEHAVSVIDAHAEYDRRLCCDGHMCGCQAATVHDEMKHYIRDYANNAAQIGAKP